MRRENRVILSIILLLVGLITAALFKPPARSEVEGYATEVASQKTPSYDETTPYVMPVPTRPSSRNIVPKLDVPMLPTPEKTLPAPEASNKVERKPAQPVSRTTKEDDVVPELPDRFPTPKKPLRTRTAKRIHTIVDGDTLQGLATRYLDDEKRWQEIYEANRGILDDPRSLPIGTKLTIPPRTADLGPQHATRPQALSAVPQRQASRLPSRSASYHASQREIRLASPPVVHEAAKPIQKTLSVLPSEPIVPMTP